MLLTVLYKICRSESEDNWGKWGGVPYFIMISKHQNIVYTTGAVLCCFPQLFTPKDYPNFMREITKVLRKKIHIILIVSMQDLAQSLLYSTYN